MAFAPIIIFAFNRLDSLKRTVRSLQANKEFELSDLFIFVDGPRLNKIGEKEKVEDVRNFVKSITGAKSINYFFHDSNLGLATSIITGTTRIIEEYNRVIVLEDDLYVSQDFLRYMNQMLDLFENDERVFQVSGFSCQVTRPKNYESDVYLSGRAHSWSWGTWKNRWDTVDWDVKDFAILSADKKKQKAFCKYGSDLYGMLAGYMSGKNNSWYIRFNYAMHKQSRFSVCPLRSLVRNDGFGDDATNCRAYNRYKISFEVSHEGPFSVSPDILPNDNLMKEAVKYWSIPYRIYGKLMTKWVSTFK